MQVTRKSKFGIVFKGGQTIFLFSDGTSFYICHVVFVHMSIVLEQPVSSQIEIDTTHCKDTVFSTEHMFNLCEFQFLYSEVGLTV